MGGSCTSQVDNGCAACAPSLFLFNVFADANYPPHGECPIYLNTTLVKQRTTNFNQTGPGPGIEANSNITQNTNSSTTVTITEDEEGNKTITTISTASSSRNGNAYVTPTRFSFNGSSSSLAITTTKVDLCGATTTSSSSSASYQFTNCTNNFCSTTGDDYFVDYVPQICFEVQPGEEDVCQVTCTTTSNCEGEEITSNGSCSSENYNSNGNSTSKTTYSNSIEDTLNSPSSIVDKKISRLKINNFPCTDGCCEKCGGANGKRDDCWFGFGGFSIPDATITISKSALKIATPKEAFLKKYKKVSGKIYFYFGGEGSPCCTDCGGPECFTGTVVKTLSYSLGGTDFFEGQYLAADIGVISNTELQAYIDETIVACITVDNIEFM